MHAQKHPGTVLYLKSIIVIFLILPSFTEAQTSHRNLIAELLKDMHQAIIDSSSIPGEELHLEFSGNSAMDLYLNEILRASIKSKPTTDDALLDSVTVQLLNYSLSLNHEPTETLRNTSYMRQLDLHLLFVIDSDTSDWRGRISDRISKGDMQKLLEESFPGSLSGDYLDGEPKLLTVGLTTLGVFSLVAALFFMRT